MKYALLNGIIDLDDVREEMRQKERERLLNKHNYKIFQSKDGRWRTTLPDPSKKDGRKLIVKSKRFDLEEAIINYYSLTEDKEYDILAFNKNTITLRELYPKWLNVKFYRTDASSYIRRIQNDWNKYYESSYIVDIPIIELTFLQLDEWAHNIIKTNKLTKKQYYNMSIIIRQCLVFATERELDIVETSPFERVKISGKMFLKKKKPQSETQVFKKNEQQLICETALEKYNKNPRFTRPLSIILNFHLGLRIGELMAIKWQDIEGDYLHVQRMETAQYEIDEENNINRQGVSVVDYTKTSAGDRNVYLNKEAKEILKLIKYTNMKYSYYDDDYIFINQNSERMTGGSFNKYLYNLCEYAGINAKSSHKIRKSFVSSLFDNGLNINKIREIAGHEDERTSLNNYCFDTNTDKESEDILEKMNYHLKISKNAI